MAIRKIIQRSTDNLFVNTEIEGTEAAKMPVGTTAQRANAKAGDQRFNSTTSLMEYYDGTQWKAIDAPPVVSSVDVTEVETSAGGTETFVISGSLFASGASVSFIASDGTTLTPDTTTVNSTTQITVTKSRSSFNNAKEPYDIKVTNATGLSNTLNDAIYVDNLPSWTTSSGNLGTIFSDDTGDHFTLVASDPDGDTVTYAEVNGSVLSGQGLSLDSSTGVISGDPTDVSSNTNLDFEVRATANSETTDRAFQITLRPPKTGIVDVFGDSSAYALYQFDGNYNDTGGNWNPTVGVNAGTLPSTGGKYGGYASYPSGSNVGSGVRVEDNTFANYFRPASTWSWSYWFDKDNYTGWHTINGSNVWWYFYAKYSGSYNFRAAHYSSGSGTNIVVAENYTPSASKWQHVALTNNPNGNFTVYINGSVIGTASSTTSTANYTSGSYRVDIVPQEGGTAGGGIDQLRMFNKELSSSEVSQLYSQGW